MKPKGPKDRFTVVPWMNPEQFKKVYNYLYNDSLIKKRWAVDQISVWNTRCQPSLPTAVEATAGIVSAEIQDMLYVADKTVNRELDIQLVYCAALIRFVGLILEHHQKAPRKISLSVLAAKHNIPTWLVDLRNEATHSFCPTLSLLRLGAEIALGYLKESFWSKEAANQKLITYLPSEQWEAETLALINQYKNLQLKRIRNGTLKGQMSKDLKVVLKKISACISHDKETFLDILVQPGNFISVEDLKKLINYEEMADFPDDINLRLPVDLQKFWLPLLGNIHNKELIPMFLDKLLLAQEECRSKICQKLAITWAIEIFAGAASTTLLARCFQKKGILFRIHSLIYACAKSATPYSKELLSIILADCKDRQKYSSLYFLLALYQGYFLPEEDSSSKRKRDTDTDLDIVFSIEDVEEELNEAKTKKMRTENDENMWSLAPVSIDFSCIPIGGVLNPIIRDASKDEQSSDDSWKEQIKIDPSVDDDFIVQKNDEEIIEETTHDIYALSETIEPEDFDMVYRRRLNK